MLPRGGYLLIGAAHRGWMDPFVAMHALPVQPRAWFLGSGPSTFTARWRERLIHRLGGLLPVWRGGVGVDGTSPQLAPCSQPRRLRPDARGHRERAAGPHRAIPHRGGADRAPHRRTRRAARHGRHGGALHRPPDGDPGPAANQRPGDSSARDWDGTLPEEGSREELDLARRVTAAFEAMLGPAVEELQPGTVDPPDHPRRLRRRLTWLFLRPGRLDRDERTDPCPARPSPIRPASRSCRRDSSGSASPRAGVAYRLLRVAWRIAAAALGVPRDVSGLENLPRTPDGRRAGG